MREREIAVTNVVPAEGQQILANGQLTPRPSDALIKIQDHLGTRVSIPSSALVAAIARQAAAEAPVNPPALDNNGLAGEATNSPPASSEAPSQYETTAK